MSLKIGGVMGLNSMGMSKLSNSFNTKDASKEKVMENKD